MVLSIENGKTQNEQSMVNNARRAVMIMQNNLNIFNKLNIFNYGFSATNAEITKTLSVNQPIKLPPSYNTKISNPELMGYMYVSSNQDVKILTATEHVIHSFNLPVPGIWCIYYEFLIKSVKLLTSTQNVNMSFINTSVKHDDNLLPVSGRIQRRGVISFSLDDAEQYSSTFYYTSTDKNVELELCLWSVFTGEFTCSAKASIIRIA